MRISRLMILLGMLLLGSCSKESEPVVEKPLTREAKMEALMKELREVVSEKGAKSPEAKAIDGELLALSKDYLAELKEDLAEAKEDLAKAKEGSSRNLEEAKQSIKEALPNE